MLGDIKSEIVFKGKKFSVRIDTITEPDGDSYKREIVEHGGAVVMIAIDHEDKLILVRQWRHATGKTLLELPAGTLEAGEAPDVTANRELQEEIGYRAKKLTPLGGFYSAPGFCSEFLHLFLAQDLEESQLEPDAHEEIELERFSLAQAVEAIEKGDIQDAKSIAGIGRYVLRTIPIKFA